MRTINSIFVIALTSFSLHTVAGNPGSSQNVKGDPLQACSKPGMAKTGYTRSGQCIDQEGDTGSHHICINLKSTSSNDKNFCQVTGQPDWCSEEIRGELIGGAGARPRKITYVTWHLHRGVVSEPFPACSSKTEKLDYPL